MNAEPVGLPVAGGDRVASPRPAAADSSWDAGFVAFVDDSGRHLLRTAVLLCGDRDRAEELVQAAYERTYRHWGRARATDPLAYTRRVLVNLRVDAWRRTRREVLAAPSSLPAGVSDDPAGEVVERNVVVRALAVLPAAQRKVVVLRHLLDLPEAQVAAELGISVGTVKSHNARALARLRQVFGEGER